MKQHAKILVVMFLIFATTAPVINGDGPGNTTGISSKVNFHTFPELGYITLYTVNVENSSEALDMFKDKCQLNNTKNLTQAQFASNDFAACITSLFNETTLMQLLHSHGIAQVAHTLCDLRPEIKQCGDKFLSSIAQCLDDVEKESLNIIKNMSKALVDHFCSYDILPDVSRIFSGVECLYTNSAVFERCFAELNLFAFPMDKKIVRMLPDFTVNKEKCSALENKTSCFHEALEGCQNTFLGRVVQKTIYIIFSEMCSKYKLP